MLWYPRSGLLSNEDSYCTLPKNVYFYCETIIFVNYRVLEVMNEVKWMKRLKLSIPNSAIEISQQVNQAMYNISSILTKES